MRHLGFDIILGFNYSIPLKKGNHGLFRARWLPEIHLGEESITMDINPAFFWDGRELHYLYTVVRADYLQNYQEVGTINVARGGAYAGTIMEE